MPRFPQWLRRAYPAGLFTVFCSSAFAGPVALPSWVVPGGNASVPTNWSTLTVPGAADHVTIASGNVTFGASTSYGALDFSGGGLNGNATLTLGTVGNSTWSGGSMTFSSGGGVTVSSGASLTISGSSTDHAFGGTVLTNVGTVNWTGGRLVSGNGGVVTNNGTWNDTASSDVTNDLGGTSLVFTNAAGATYNKSGAGQTNFYVPFNNAGGVTVTTGTLALQGGGSSTGNIAIADGAAVQISGNYGFSGGTLDATGIGTGNVAIASGTTTFDKSTSGSANVVVSGGNATFNGTHNGTGKLSVGPGGTVNGTGGAQFGSFDWSGGTLAGNVTAPEVNLSGGAKNLYGGTLTLTGNTAWDGSALSATGGSITNNSGATFSANGDGVLSTAGNATLTNAGLLVKNGGSGETEIQANVTNTGTLTANSGTLRLSGGGSSSNALNVGDGATLKITDHDFAITGGSLNATGTSGNGTIELASATTTFSGGTAGNANLLVDGGTATFNGAHTGTGKLFVAAGGTVNGSGAAQFGSLDWSGGTLAGNVTVGDGSLNGGAKTLYGGTLTLTGNTAWDGTALSSNAGGRITNAVGAMFSVTNDGTLTNLGNATLVNAGSLAKTGGTGVTEIQAGVTNTGTVAINSGLLRLTNGMANGAASTTSVASGAELDLTNGGSFASGAQLGGGGVARLAAGLLEANNTISVGTFIFDGGQLTGTNHFAGMVEWNAGDWSANSGDATTIDASGTLQIGTGSQHDFNARSIVNNGTVDWTSGDLRSGNGAAFTNTGTIYDGNTGSVAVQSSTFGGPFSITNTGSYIKAGGGTTTIAVPFTNNNGTVDVTSGTLVFSSTYTHGGGNFFVGSGATAQFSNGLHVDRGSLVGAGTIIGNVASNGILATGSAPGKLAINGDLSLLSSSTLLVQIGGTTQGSGYDFFAVSGNATIGGLLDISMLNGVASSILSTDTFTILSSGGLSGAFANVGNGQRLLTRDGISSFQVNYGGGLNGIVLSNFEAVPEPSTYALMVAGLAIVGLGVRRRRARQQQD